MRRRVLSTAFALVLCAVSPLAAATRTWSGLGADTNWTTAGNWDTLPVAGDDLVFPGGVPAPSLTNNNDFPAATSFPSITFSGNGYTLNGNSITLGAAGIVGTTSAAPGFNTINLNIVLGADATLDVVTNSRLEMFGSISGAFGVTKVGGGLFRLRTANSYSGNSVINAGFLSIENTQTASAVQVNAGGTLTGANAGNMGAVTSTGGTIDPGVLPLGSAIITVSGNLTLDAASTFVVDLNALLSFDRVAPTGTTNLGGSTLSVSENFASAVGDSFNIIANSGGAIVGTFAGLPEGAVFAVGASFYSISYVAGDGNDVTLTHVAGGGPTPTPTITPTITSTATVTPAATSTPTATPAGVPTATSTPQGGPGVSVPMLSFPIWMVLAAALGAAGLFLMRRLG